MCRDLSSIYSVFWGMSDIDLDQLGHGGRTFTFIPWVGSPSNAWIISFLHLLLQVLIPFSIYFEVAS